ncbi:phage tail protein [Proteus mirabilis]|uniref:phage tail-collar fiber domain-containing protein n=1 Tax=Proteus TaxID=583 RepID=UPI000D96E65F|nr:MULTISPECIES: phage tail protein [Proteus]ELB1539818.1 phage tail protein [Proteus mirabilis]ELT1804561.1 phage tail protein [Proteus mirabilis]EMD9368168.1 phage tail protein [Proteus mirabilis]MDC5895192.1 phage tail protein [Proteus mirabilis]MDC5916326.1 phage tail protein [Proteus mirabilis]
MSQSIITTAFERWKAQESIDGNLIVLDEFVFAHIPNLEIEKPIDRNEGLPDAKYIMHRQTVNKTGVVNQNAVAYSVTIGAEIGDFDFNWIGLLNKKSGTVAMIVHAPTQRKIKTQAGQQGNVLTRSFLLEYLGASKETAITTPAEMWQIDFTARLSGIDEMQRLVNTDSYGEASFFDDAFLVAKTGNQYFVTKGIGYIGGLRAELITNQNITVPAENTKVYADVSYQGNITSRWQTHIKLTVKPDLKNYIDNADFAHFVFAIASISADGKVTDLRPKGTLDFQQLDDALKKHAQSRNHPDATLTAKGFTQLTDKTGTSQALAPTQKLVTDLHNNAMASAKSANDNANTRLPSTGTAVASQKLATPRKISGVPFDGTKDITLNAGNVGAATPAQVNEVKTMASNAQNTANSAVTKADNAQKTANDGVSKANTAQTTANNANNNANGRVPNTRKVNGKQLNADITLNAGDVGASTPAQVNEAKTMATNAQNTANSAVTKANTAQTTANNANNNANGRVPNARKVNGKQLNKDIHLNAVDVGALTQVQGDERYQRKGVNAIWRKIGDFNGESAVTEITLTENILGKLVFVQRQSGDKTYTGFLIPPIPEIRIGVPMGQQGYWDFIVSKDGKKLKMIDSNYGSALGVYIYD